MKADVLLIKPDFKDIAIMPPLGLGYLASKLKRIGISVWIHDNTLFGYDDRKMADLIKQANPKIVGIYAATPMIRRAIEIAHVAKKINSGILTVLGGPHPTCKAEEALLSADLVVMGEGEETFPEIAKRFIGGSRDFSDIKGCAFLKPDKGVVVTPARDMISDLDSVPFPALDIMPIDQYFKKGSYFGILLQRHLRSLPIIASRGCPFDCTFCQRFMGRRFRIRSPENIVDELSHWKKKFAVAEFNFLDDNFTLDKKCVIEVCDLIHKRDLKISFRFPNGVREDYLDEDILCALKSVGCYHLDFGIESGSQKVLGLMKKGKRIEKIAEKVDLCHRRGFKLSATFLFGTPGETLEDMEETIKFATSLPLDNACFSLVIPFPGTELREEVIRKGYLLHSDYDYYNPTLNNRRHPIETPEWTADDLIHMISKANCAFFYRPKQILKLFPAIFNTIDLRRYAVLLRKAIRKLRR